MLNWKTDEGKTERRHFIVWNICLERDDTVKTSMRFFCLQWDLWIVTMTQERWIRWQTKAAMMSVDFTEGHQIPLKSFPPRKITFAPPGFRRQIESLSRVSTEGKGRYSILKGMTYSIPREDKQQKHTGTQMKEKNISVQILIQIIFLWQVEYFLKKEQFISSQGGCSDTRSSAVPPGEQKQGASSPSSQEHCQAEKAEITGLQRANCCLCACS